MPVFLNCLISVPRPAENIIRMTPILARKDNPSIAVSVNRVWLGMSLIRPSRMPATIIPMTCGRPSFLPSKESSLDASRIKASGKRSSSKFIVLPPLFLNLVCYTTKKTNSQVLNFQPESALKRVRAARRATTGKPAAGMAAERTSLRGRRVRSTKDKNFVQKKVLYRVKKRCLSADLKLNSQFSTAVHFV